MRVEVLAEAGATAEVEVLGKDRECSIRSYTKKYKFQNTLN